MVNKYLKKCLAFVARCLAAVVGGSAAAYGIYAAFDGRMENFHSTTAVVFTSLIFLIFGCMTWVASKSFKSGVNAVVATGIVFFIFPWVLVSGLNILTDTYASFPNWQ